MVPLGKTQYHEIRVMDCLPLGVINGQVLSAFNKEVCIALVDKIVHVFLTDKGHTL